MNKPHFYIYDASAGSGKTYTITREYLCILLQQEKVFAFQNILAITFTNKAAAEMKQRIINALVFFAGLKTDVEYDNLLDDVAIQTGFSKPKIQKKSLQILKYLIPNYAGFEVSTIDSFNHRIIKTFAKDLKLSQNFEVEMEVEPILKKAVENLINEVGIDDNLTTWLADFVNYKIDRNKSGDIILDLFDYAQLVLNENNYQALRQIDTLDHKNLKRIKSQLTNQIKSVKKELKIIGEDFFKFLDDNQIEPQSFYKYIIDYFNNIQNDKIVDEFKSKWHDIKNHSLYKKSTHEIQKQSIDEVRIQIEDLFLKSKALSLKYHINERILKSFVPLAMISEIQRHIKNIKEEEGILFINDFNRLISQHIKHQPAPFIYERLGEKFRHYFIDEFQDTSRLQWHNLIPLIDNALSGEHEDGIPGHLYIVGDVKQSIYEWRGGDPQQFLDLSQGYSNPFSIEMDREILESNWRSAKTIVDFNNGFFEYAAQFLTNPDQKQLYLNAKQHPQNTNEGYVDIRFLPEQADNTIQHQQHIKELQQIINKLADQGYRLSDICILVRQNKYGSAIVESFNELDKPIPVISQESLLIASDDRVKLLTQFLKLNQDFNTDLCVDFFLLWFNHLDYNTQSYHKALSELKGKTYQEIIELLHTYNIDFNLMVYENLSLYDKAEYALRSLGLHHQANAYIQFFLDEIYEFSNSKSSSLAQFLDYWEEQKDKKSISTSGSQNAVNIMTIHKSKGLEFPVVIYANANFEWCNLSRSYDWVNIEDQNLDIQYTYDNISKKSKNLSTSFEESYQRHISKVELANLNAAYVCMTRASEQLYILSEPLRASALKFEDILVGYLKYIENYKENQNRYSFGQPLDKKNSGSESQHIEPSTFYSTDVEGIYNTLSADTSYLNLKDDNRIYGEEIHNQLQKIKYHQDIGQEKLSNITQLKNIIHHPELSEYFENQWNIYNEKEICFEGKILRPDRICVKDDKAVIIDYKTGKEETSHFKQLTEYKEALEALGFSIKTSILVYIRKNINIIKI
ncbi:MAG: UvrD-helicase domain-containing protein [Bacteroidetes bacterium]|nr:UvrD-helicase domain-containing protein [Bacteroidota bacterium]